MAVVSMELSGGPQREDEESQLGVDAARGYAMKSRGDDPPSPSSTTFDGSIDCDADPEKGEVSPVQTNQPSALRQVISRTLSRNSAPADPGPPPDGGAAAWTQVLFAHLVIFNTWGYINSYGVFQTYYTNTLSASPSAISWVGSVQIFLLFFIGAISGRATDAGYFRHAFFLGSFFQLLGMFMTSLCTSYWQLFLAQGVCTGLGNGIVFCPTIALIPTYFSRRRTVALGLVSCGTATGGLVFPGIIEALLPTLGFGWTLRVLAFIATAIQTSAFFFLKPRLPPRSTGPLLELSAFREPPYAFFTVGMVFAIWGLYPAFYFIGEYATSVLHIPQSYSINLLLTMNGVGIVGRLVPAYIADTYTGPMNMLLPAVCFSAVSVYSWIAVSSEGGLFAFAAVYGIFASGVQGLFPPTLASLSSDLSKTGTRIGMVFTVISFASLTGSPIAGALISQGGGGGGEFLGPQLFAATCFALALLALLASRISKTGWVLRKRM